MKKYKKGPFVLFADTENPYEVVCNLCGKFLYEGVETLANVGLGGEMTHFDWCEECAKKAREKNTNL